MINNNLNIKISIIGLTGHSIFMKVDNFHKPGETIQAKKINIEPGGKGYNQAIACARLNMNVSYLTSVGNDSYGIECEQYMKKENIKTFFSEKETNTAVATILTNHNGDNQVTVFKGASENLSLEDLNNFKDEIKSSNILLVQNEIPYNVLKESIKYASENNVYVILNPAPAVYDLIELLPYINLLIPNEAEAMQIYNKDYNDITIKSDLKLIITLGSKGCLYIDKNNKKYYKALNVNAIDTTGAGDVFCAAISSFIKQEENIDKVIKLATISSALHVQKKYVIDATPTIEEVYDVYNKKEA